MRGPSLRGRVGALAVGVALCGALAPASALAHGGGAYAQATTPPAPPGDGAKAEELLAKVDAEVKGTERAAIVREAVGKARHALERAHGARTSGDEPHAAMLSALALDWARVATALLTASNAERSAEAAAKESQEAGTKVERARALLAESQAQRGVVAAELLRIEAEAKAKRDAAAEAEAARLGAKKGEPAKPKDSGARPKAKPAPQSAPRKP